MQRLFLAGCLLPLLLWCNGVFGQNALDVSSLLQKDYQRISPSLSGPFTDWPVSNAIPDSLKGILFEQRPVIDSFDGRIFCFSFSVKNSSNLNLPFVVVLGNNAIRTLELFEMTPTGLRSMGRTGNGVPVDSRPHRSFLFYYALSAGPHMQTDYRLYFTSVPKPNYLTLYAFGPEAFNHRQSGIFVLFGLFAGCILLTSLFNLFLYFFVRDKVHLYYFFYAVINCFVLLSMENMDAHLLYPSLTTLTKFNKSTFAILSLFFCIQIMQLFLGQTKENSRFYVFAELNKKILLVILPLNILLCFYGDAQLWQQVRIYLFSITLLSGIVCVLLSSIEKARQGSRYAIFYLAAVFTMFAGAVSILFQIMWNVGLIKLPPSLLEVGLVLETLIISFGILYRYILIKRENEKLAQALQSEKVRSAELIINTQELEQKRIAQDLHDELGGNLAAIKMRLQSLSTNGAMSSIIGLLDNATERARNIAHNLMPPGFEQASLDNLLKNYFESFNGGKKPAIQFFISGTPCDFDKRRALMVYRIVLELTQNIFKHAKASYASVQLVYFETYLEVVAEDNGNGILHASANGIGLQSIRSRVQYLEGEINIDSNAHGTTVVVRVPFKMTAHESTR